MCIWCDDANHKCGNCGLYEDAMKSSIITFKKDMIEDVAINDPLEIKFERGSLNFLLRID